MTKTYNACTLKKKKDEFKWYDGSAYKTKNFNGNLAARIRCKGFRLEIGYFCWPIFSHSYAHCLLQNLSSNNSSRDSNIVQRHIHLKVLLTNPNPSQSVINWGIYMHNIAFCLRRQIISKLCSVKPFHYNSFAYNIRRQRYAGGR